MFITVQPCEDGCFSSSFGKHRAMEPGLKNYKIVFATPSRLLRANPSWARQAHGEVNNLSKTVFDQALSEI